MNYHIITLGCQMNVNDSERIDKFFENNGLKKTDLKKADIVIVNACSIRESAINRIHGKMKNIKDKTRILTGCVLEKDKKKLKQHFDYILKVEDVNNWPLSFIKKRERDFFNITPKRKGSSALISVMTGCDNFCSYCAVPYTKGREKSRKVEDVINEAKDAINQGAKEIWLLGQNVNSYKGGASFAELLQMVNEISGDFWIRFTSSHPKDFSDDLIKAMKDCDKVTEYLNLPVQSGDDKILEAMNRPYTIKKYMEIIRKAREAVPNISISTDVIVGFPGETERQFRNTIKVFMEAQFEMAYISSYSPRPGTKAEKIKDNISPEEKKRRKRVLTEILKEISLNKNRDYKGRELDLLVFKKHKDHLLGKTRNYKTVVFKSSQDLIGKFIKVKITHVSPWGLKGKLL